jgi:hypothetical protein
MCALKSEIPHKLYIRVVEVLNSDLELGSGGHSFLWELRQEAIPGEPLEEEILCWDGWQGGGDCRKRGTLK